MMRNCISSSRAYLASNARSRSSNWVMRCRWNLSPGEIGAAALSVQRHHQLADRRSVAQLGDRFASTLQRKGRADPGRDLPFRPPAEQLADMLGVAFRLARDERAP